MTERLRNGLKEWWPIIALLTSVFVAPTTAWVLTTTIEQGKQITKNDGRLNAVEKQVDSCIKAEDLANLCTQIARLETNVVNLEKLLDKLDDRVGRGH